MSRIGRRLGLGGYLLLAACSGPPADELLSRADLAGAPADGSANVDAPPAGDLAMSPDGGGLDGASGGLSLLSVVSRKAHGFASFEVPIDLSAGLLGSTAAVSIEPRAIGMGHVLVFHFSAAISSAGTPSIYDAAGAGVPVGSATAVVSGQDVIMTLTGVPDAHQVTARLTGVNGSLNAAATIGFLLGDIDASRAVTDADKALVNNALSQQLSTSNFRCDVDASGTITLTDFQTVSSTKGSALP